ncbi:hypothetical protein WAI453_010430 [Rhynchosporium graminicola]
MKSRVQDNSKIRTGPLLAKDLYNLLLSHDLSRETTICSISTTSTEKLGVIYLVNQHEESNKSKKEQTKRALQTDLRYYLGYSFLHAAIIRGKSRDGKNM